MSGSQSFKGVPGFYRRHVVVKFILIFIVGLALTTITLYMAVGDSIGPSYGEGFRMLAQLQQDILYKSAIIYAITVFITLWWHYLSSPHLFSPYCWSRLSSQHVYQGIRKGELYNMSCLS